MAQDEFKPFLCSFSLETSCPEHCPSVLSAPRCCLCLGPDLSMELRFDEHIFNSGGQATFIDFAVILLSLSSSWFSGKKTEAREQLFTKVGIMSEVLHTCRKPESIFFLPFLTWLFPPHWSYVSSQLTCTPFFILIQLSSSYSSSRFTENQELLEALYYIFAVENHQENPYRHRISAGNSFGRANVQTCDWTVKCWHLNKTCHPVSTQGYISPRLLLTSSGTCQWLHWRFDIAFQRHDLNDIHYDTQLQLSVHSACFRNTVKLFSPLVTLNSGSNNSEQSNDLIYRWAFCRSVS